MNESEVSVEDALKAVEKEIDEELIKYRSGIRTAAVLYVLNSSIQAAGDYVSTLPSPVSSYDDNFFNRFTSQLIHNTFYYTRAINEGSFCSYAMLLNLMWKSSVSSRDSEQLHLNLKAPSRHGIIARKILKATGMHEAASMADILRLSTRGKLFLEKFKKN